MKKCLRRFCAIEEVNCCFREKHEVSQCSGSGFDKPKNYCEKTRLCLVTLAKK